MWSQVGLRNITTSKASGGDGIPVELFQILKDDSVKVLHSICQQIWKTQQWPQDWKRSVFIPIPKKGNDNRKSDPLNYYSMLQKAAWRWSVGCTWTSPDGQHRNKIDYILCSQRWRSSIHSAKTGLGADCGSNHELLIASVRLKLKKVGKTSWRRQWQPNVSVV